MPPTYLEHYEDEDSDTFQPVIGESHSGVSEFSFAPRLSSFFQELGRADLVDKFTEVSDTWPPLSRGVLRQLMQKPEIKSFLEFQSQFLLSEWPEDFSVRHMNFEDECDPPFDTERQLGVGGFGTVDLVKDPITSRTYAMKVVSRPHSYKDHFKAMNTLSKEIAIMRQVKHRHCVELCASWTDVDSVYFLCSPVAEMDLDAFMNLDHRDGRRHAFLRQAIGCLCTALKYLHDHKIRHEDIKPRNILVYRSTVLLTDFGLSHDFSYLSNSTTTGVPAGLTMRYAAPEAMSQEPRNRSSDIWELGCVLIEMISCLRGYNLLEAQEFWKRNRASSFEVKHVTMMWCDMLRSERSDVEHPSSIDQYGTVRKDMALLSFIQDCMLQTKGKLRPSIGQVCEKLKDMEFVYPLGPTGSWFRSCCHDNLLFMQAYWNETLSREQVIEGSRFQCCDDDRTVPEWPLLDLEHLDSQLSFVVLDLDLNVVIVRSVALASPMLKDLEKLDQFFVKCDLEPVRQHLIAKSRHLQLRSSKIGNLFSEAITPAEILRSFDATAIKDNVFYVNHFDVYLRDREDFPQLLTIQFSLCKFQLRVNHLKDIPYVMMVFDSNEGKPRALKEYTRKPTSWKDGLPMSSPYREVVQKRRKKFEAETRLRLHNQIPDRCNECLRGKENCSAKDDQGSCVQCRNRGVICSTPLPLTERELRFSDADYHAQTRWNS